MTNKQFLPESKLQKIDRFLFMAIRAVSCLSGICLVGIMLTAFFNVLGEKLFKHGIPASTEIIQYLHIPVVFLSAAYVSLDRGHTAIDLLSSHFPKALQRICGFLGNLLGVFICSFAGYRGLTQMERFFVRHRMSSVTGVGFPLWPFALILSAGFILLALSFLRKILCTVTGIDPTTDAASAESGEDAHGL
jgi:TRAP-type C4-dicarboxylate transport system permease small subunit